MGDGDGQQQRQQEEQQQQQQCIIENIPADIAAAALGGVNASGGGHRSPPRAAGAGAAGPPAQILHPSPPSGVLRADETGGSNLSDLTDDGGLAALLRNRGGRNVADLSTGNNHGSNGNRNQQRQGARPAPGDNARTNGGNGNVSNGNGNSRGEGLVLNAECQVADIGANNTAGGEEAPSSLRSPHAQPDLLDDDEAGGRGGPGPPVLEHMPTDVGELLRRANSQDAAAAATSVGPLLTRSSHRPQAGTTAGQQRKASSSTAGGGSSSFLSDPNMAAVPNAPTPTRDILDGGGGAGGAGTGIGTAAASRMMLARSRSAGAPPTVGRPGNLRRNATDESAGNRGWGQGQHGGGSSPNRSTVTFTDEMPDRSGGGGRTAAASAAAPSSEGATNSADIHDMSRGERDRLLRELLSAQEREASEQQRRQQQQQQQQQQGASLSARSSSIGARDSGDGRPTDDADGSVDPSVAEMIRRQEEAALRLSLAESRGSVARGSEAARAAESARAVMQESDDQMFNRALEISRTETTARRPAAAAAAASTGNGVMNDEELQRVLELSREDVGGRQHTSDEDEEEMMRRVLNMSLHDTGGRQYIRGGPRSSAVYAPPPNVARGTSMGEGGIPRQTSVGNRIGGRVTVSGAGIEAVNGTYTLSGTCNSVNMYSQKGQWEGKDVMFTLYRCFLDPEAGVEGDLGTPRLWFISIVPPDVKPGTDEDKDFYVARGSEDAAVIPTESPPESGWAPVEPFGEGNPPACLWEPPPTLHEVDEEPLVAAPRVPEVHVHAAGSEQVNGTYKPVGEAPVTVYVNNVTWMGEELRIHIFRSHEDDDDSIIDAEKRWFLSIVPEGCSPGSSADTDLYVATEIAGAERKTGDGRYIFPPSEGWKTIRGFGLEPPPVCLTETDDEDLQSRAAPLPRKSNVSSGTDSVAGDLVPGTVNRVSKTKSSSSSGLTSATRHTPCVRVTDENNEIRTRKVAMCVVCKTKKVTHILVPCGHPCLCANCAEYGELEAMDWHCPVGRCKIERVMRFFGTLVEEGS